MAPFLALDLATGDYDILANGIRNSVGFDWHPQTGEIWFSDNNRQQFDNRMRSTVFQTQASRTSARQSSLVRIRAV